MIHYIDGDVTMPRKEHYGKGGVMICHLCNAEGVMGSGVALGIKRKWPGAYEIYRSNFEACQRRNTSFFGDVSYYCEDKIIVANMVAMSYCCTSSDHINYEALEECISAVYDQASFFDLNMIMPKIGSLRAGGNWDVIETLIKKYMIVPTFIYLFREPGKVAY